MSIKTAVWQEATRKVKKEKKNALNRAKTDEEKRKNQLRALRGTETKKPVGSGIGAAVTGSGGSGSGVGAAGQNGAVQSPRKTAESGGSQQQEYAWQRKYAGKSSTDLQNIALELDDGKEKDFVLGYAAYMDEEEKGSFDLEAGQAEIDALEAKLAELRRQKNAGVYGGAPYAAGQGSAAAYGMPYAAAQQGGDDIDRQIRELEKQISEKKRYLNTAKRIQSWNALASAPGNADFGQYSGYVSTVDPQGGAGDETYEWINNRNGYREQYEADRAERYKTQNTGYGAAGPSSAYTSTGYGAGQQAGIDRPVPDSEYEQKGYDYLEDEEIAIYNYYYAKEGKEKAQQYLDSIQEKLNQRKAKDMFAKMEGNTAAEIVFGIAAGGENFAYGVKNLFNFDGEYVPFSAFQYAGEMAREDLADDSIGIWYNFKEKKWEDNILGNSLGQIAYDTVNTTANMVPSILAATAANIIVPGSGAWVGSMLMGMSAGGNAYQQALNEGFDKDEARMYGIMVGASEMIMEKFVGGIEKFGGNAAGRFFARNMGAADKALKMIAKQIGSMASEFTEEYLQTVLEPVLQNIILDTDHEVEFISPEALYAGILGALTAAVMAVPSHVGGSVRTTGSEKNPVAAGTGIQRLAPVGKNPSPEAVANRMAAVTDESTDAFTMGELFGELGGELTRQNVSDITEALIEEGMDERTARKNARILWYVVKNGPVSALQTAMIERNDVLAKVMREVVIDPYCTVDPQSIGYNEILRRLARETVARNSGRGWNTAAVRKESGGKVSSDGEMVNIIEGIDGISAEDAGEILRILKAEPGDGYAGPRGAREAYLYGFQGRFEADLESRGGFARMLTETQRKEIYEIGRKAGGWQEKEAAMAADKGEFERYRSVLGENAPKTLEEFCSIKYNDSNKWDALKHRYGIVEQYEVVGDVTVDRIVQLDEVAFYEKKKGFDYSAFTGNDKQNIKKEISNGGNATSMEFDGKLYFAHSKFGLPDSREHSLYKGKYPAVTLSKDRMFKVKDLGDGVPRQYDTEAKFLEFVATQKSPDDRFTVTILSEKHICESCEYVVEQFRKKFPNATVNIVSGKRGYNGDEKGRHTWKHRKEAK